jgi:hypothetical protein
MAFGEATKKFHFHYFMKQKGGGCEPEQYYALWKRLNRHLDKHTVLQESFMKLMDGM